MTYEAAPNRYERMPYVRCGRSGLKLSAISLGLWQNCGASDSRSDAKRIIFRAFDSGITHFDLANNYGPPPGAAEKIVGGIIHSELRAYRDEIVVSTKAGHEMWPGPYGDWGSRKSLIASLDQSLRRLGVDYVDIFYHHRPDPETPLEETMATLDDIVRSGKALYVGISKYPPDRTRKAAALLRKLGTPCLVHQDRYNIFDRRVEDSLLDALEQEGLGFVAFQPFAQGVLTDRYVNGIPAGSRATKETANFLRASLGASRVAKIKALSGLAAKRGQTLAQMALLWVRRLPVVTTVLFGASRPEHIDDAVAALNAVPLSTEELESIDRLSSG